MNTAASLIVLLLLATASYFGIRWLVRACSRYRGTKIVTCPETGRPTIVEVDALHASMTSTVGLPDIRLENCSRWPLKQQCGQQCLTSLDVEPGQCLVNGVLMRWYRGKPCVYCQKPFDELHWMDHKPALLSPQGELVRWYAVHVDNLSAVLETHLPVCWNCYTAQSFQRKHPDLVVYRPWLNDIAKAADCSSLTHHLYPAGLAMVRLQSSFETSKGKSSHDTSNISQSTDRDSAVRYVSNVRPDHEGPSAIYTLGATLRHL